MSKVVNTKFGDRGLVNLPAVKLGGTKSPVVNTIAPIESSMANPALWYGGACPPLIVGPQLQPPVYGPGNFLPPPGMLDQLTQQAYVPSMQVYGYGQYPMVGGAPQAVQYVPQPIINPMLMQPPQCKMAPCQHFNRQFPQGQNIFYGPDGKVLPGPPPGFALDGSQPRNPTEYPEDFAIESVLDYGKLRSVRLIEGTKRFPKIPEYLHKELMIHYKQFRKCYVKIVARGGEIHVHASPLEIGYHPLEEPRSDEYEYVPVYLDENGQIIGRAEDRSRTSILDADDDAYSRRVFERGPFGYRYPVLPVRGREFYYDLSPRRDIRGPIPIYDRSPIFDRERLPIYDREPIFDREPLSTFDRSTILNRSPISPPYRKIYRPGTDY